MRDGLSPQAPSPAATLLGLAALALAFGPLASACGGRASPSDEAVSAWLDRSGLPPLAPSQNTTRPSSTDLGDAPVARRMAITVESASGLPDMDAGPGVTDPYVILEYEGQRQRTSVIEGSLEPIWGDTFIFDVSPGGVLVVKLMDEDALSSDELIGTVSVPLPAVLVGESTPLELTFRKGEGGTLRMTLTGMVRP